MNKADRNGHQYKIKNAFRVQQKNSFVDKLVAGVVYCCHGVRPEGNEQDEVIKRCIESEVNSYIFG